MILNFFFKHNAYKHIFFDLDRTLWDFEQNMRDALAEIFVNRKLDIAFPDKETFIECYNRNNNYLWDKYLKGELTKDVLRYKRFDITLKEYGINNKELAKTIGEEYLEIMPLKTALIPGTHEVLEYLAPKYNLHILSNGFKEVQLPKLKRCNIDHYFECVVTSEHSGYHKPDKRAFGYALSKANAKKSESLMVGDDYEVDIMGAKKFGIDQIYFSPNNSKSNSKATFVVERLNEIIKIL
ncbi:MAG: putative hydrolase of the superfamily [Tenuifilum sp.]|jgi:putative hydrolase of the HAD superfamily|uniref:YjjG family noncanonical pyrimidine nucleotidase n=1 Tax=Tenuifilum sp. TaxID=2760880 RepID=UPI0024AA762F|nr:YjjG family noncanonical pyrimidine nucleotidase [Tenuifilum sp.]MDI3526393.1 putative hydrolase of the superfamily [Tenuifilum sp.]